MEFLTMAAAQVIRAGALMQPLPAKTEGWSATTYAIVSICTPILIALIYGLFRFIPVMTTIANAANSAVNAANEKIRADLLAEVKVLREHIASNDRECIRRLDGMQSKMDAVTLKFFEAQIQILHSTSSTRASDAAHVEFNKVLAVIKTPVDEFMADKEPPRKDTP